MNLKDAYQPQTTEITPPLMRSLERVVSEIPSGSVVALEGTPLYLDSPWGSGEEFLTNSILTALQEALHHSGSTTRHIALVDDYTPRDGAVTVEDLISPMRISPEAVYLESQFVEAAVQEIGVLRQRNRVTNGGGRLCLAARPQPPLTTNGRPSCELLDALFQRLKPVDVSIVAHPKAFRSQQEGMRAILQEISGGVLPFVIINLFFKGSNISGVLLTERNGQSRQLPL